MSESRLRGGPAPVPQGTVIDALAIAANSDAKVTFVGRDEQETSLPWRTVRARAMRVASALRARGVRRGDCVAILLRTSPEFLDCFFGVQLAGAIPVPLYPPVRLGRLDEHRAATVRMLVRARACLVITDRMLRRLLGRPILEARPALGCVEVEELVGTVGAFHDTAADTSTGEPISTSPDDLALVQFSSGTTVDPKPVALTHAQILAQCAALKALFPTPKGYEQVGVSWLPLYHDMGLIGVLLGGVTVPGSIVLIPPEHFLGHPALWLRAIARHRGTISPAPSFAYALCAARVRDEDLAGHDLSSWRLALNGAEPVSVEGLRRFAARFARFGFDPNALLPVYGLSEAALAVTFPPPGRRTRTTRVDARHLAAHGEVRPGRREIASVGMPIPGVELELRDPEGAVSALGRVGRIFVRGPSVMSGYLESPEATAEVLVDGWLDTGDLGFVLDGELYVSGRAKDVVVVRGANHAPQEFEDAVEGLPGLRAGCAVAAGFVAEPSGEETLLLLAERARRPDGLSDEELLAAMRARLLERTATTAHTIELLAPGTLPRTSSGKLRRAEALRRWLAGELTPPKKMNAARLLLEAVRSAFALARLGSVER